MNILDEIKKEINKVLPKAKESDGWEAFFNGTRKECCPGDDWADGWNKARKNILKILKKFEDKL